MMRFFFSLGVRCCLHTCALLKSCDEAAEWESWKKKASARARRGRQRTRPAKQAKRSAQTCAGRFRLAPHAGRCGAALAGPPPVLPVPELATGVYGRAGHRLHADTCHPWTAPVAGQSMRSVVLQPPPPRFAGILRFAGVSDWASQDLVPIVGALLRSLFNIIRLVPRSRRVSSGSSSSTKPQMGRTASFIDRVRRPRPMHDAAVS